MNQRQGATLLEVLVAIFVMGIGLLALLTLFPLGALKMAEAITADRCAQCFRIANNNATYRGVRNDPWVVDLGKDVPVQAPAGTDPMVDPWWVNGVKDPNMKAADPDGASFPVLVDPAGAVSAAGLPSQTWITNSAGTIRRRSVDFVHGAYPGTPSSKALRWFTLLDDLIFDAAGSPRPIAAGLIERDIRYSWAYMLKRPRSSNVSVVDLTVVVFNRRTLALTNNLDLNENLYQTTPPLATPSLSEVIFSTAQNTITLTPDVGSGNTLPPARVGDWLLDASYIPMPNPNQSIANNPYGTVNGNFYRIVGMNEITAAATPTMEYEVQPELRNFPATNGAQVWRKVIFMDGVAEVLDKGTGRVP